MNQTVYTVFADPTEVNDEDKVIETVRKIAGGNAKSNLQELLDKKTTRYQVLATKVTREQANKIKEVGLKGVGFQEGTQRVYPEGALAAQVLGFVNYDGVGQYGVEGGLEEELTGEDGLLQSVTDISSVPLTIGENNIKKPAVDGKNIVLSIDRNIQSYTEKALKEGLEKSGAKSGNVIVMNAQNGQVMAMANYPSYDPANISSVEDISVFNNGVISTPYEPGSDIKTLTMATGIDKGVVSPEATYYNTDHIRVDDRVINNAVLGYTGDITFQFALNWSLNTGFVTVAERLGNTTGTISREARNTMYDYFYNRFGLGRLTGIELANEAKGTVISPEETEGNAVRYSNMSFGQGMDVTMIQVAAAFCSVVNGGNYYKPSIIAGVIDENGNYVENSIANPTHPISESAANQVRSMTQIARNTFYSYYDLPGYYVGGKTGTSQVIIDGEYSGDTTVGTYLGFGGSEEQTSYVIMVQASGEHQLLGGSKDAMPIFTNISNWMLNYLKIQPKE